MAKQQDEGYVKKQQVGPKHSIHPGASGKHAVESIADPNTGKLKQKVRERVSP